MKKIATLCFLLFSLQSFGLENPYFVVGGGFVFPSKDSKSGGNSSAVLFSPTIPGTSLFSLPNVTWENSYDQGYELYAAVGCSFTPCFRSEIEFVYQDIERQITGYYDWLEIDATTTDVFARDFGNPIADACVETKLYCLLPSLYYDFCAFYPFTVSIGAGIGVVWLDSSRTLRSNILQIDTTVPPLDETSPTIELSPALTGTAFAWQFKAGLNYDIRQDLTFGLNYRLLGTTSFQTSTSSITTNPGTDVSAYFEVPRDTISGFLNNSISLAITYWF